MAVSYGGLFCASHICFPDVAFTRTTLPLRRYQLRGAVLLRIHLLSLNGCWFRDVSIRFFLLGRCGLSHHFCTFLLLCIAFFAKTPCRSSGRVLVVCKHYRVNGGRTAALCAEETFPFSTVCSACVHRYLTWSLFSICQVVTLLAKGALDHLRISLSLPCRIIGTPLSIIMSDWRGESSALLVSGESGRNDFRPARWFGAARQARFYNCRRHGINSLPSHRTALRTGALCWFYRRDKDAA